MKKRNYEVFEEYFSRLSMEDLVKSKPELKICARHNLAAFIGMLIVAVIHSYCGIGDYLEHGISWWSLLYLFAVVIAILLSWNGYVYYKKDKELLNKCERYESQS